MDVKPNLKRGKLTLTQRKPGNSEPVPYGRTIAAAFERQKSGKTCPICGKNVLVSHYRRHVDSCTLSSDDQECQVLCSYTKEEAALLSVGPPIVLDENDQVSSPASPNANTSENSNLRASKIKETAEGAAQCCRRRISTRSVTMRETTVELRNTEELPEKSAIFETSKLKRSSKVISDSHPVSLSNNSPHQIVKREQLKAVDLVAHISTLLPEKREKMSDDANGNEPPPYFVHFVLRIFHRVLTSKYDESFWLNSDLEIVEKYLNLSNDAKILFLRLFLRKPQWLSVAKLQLRYSNLKSVELLAKELVAAGLLDSEFALKTLEDALGVADIVVLKKISRMFQLDFNKGKLELSRSMLVFANSQKSIFGSTGTTAVRMVKELKSEVGKLVRVKSDVAQLLKAFMTLYSPTETNSALAVDNPRHHIYQEMLCIEAKEMEVQILTATSAGKLEDAFNVACSARHMLTTIKPETKSKSALLPVHLRKFTDIWVLTRICGHGASVLEKQKNYAQAVEWHRFLLLSDDLRRFCGDSRGAWWDRLSLNLDAHLKDRDGSADVLRMALDDDLVLEKEVLQLQDRADRLLKNAYTPKVIVRPPNKVEIKALTLSKNLGDGRVNRFVIDDVECSVEEVVRQRYLSDEPFTRGFHDEGGAWHTVFGVLFYEIIFDRTVASTWLSELQASPADLNYSLYENRKGEFDDRLKWLENADDGDLRSEAYKVWADRCTETNRECTWSLFEGPGDLFDFIVCIPRNALCAVISRMVRNYRNCRSGFPDLTLWDPVQRNVAVVEVKGPGDRLSTKQRLWLSHFAANGVRAEVCHVVAENKKRIG